MTSILFDRFTDKYFCKHALPMALTFCVIRNTHKSSGAKSTKTAISISFFFATLDTSFQSVHHTRRFCCKFMYQKRNEFSFRCYNFWNTEFVVCNKILKDQRDQVQGMEQEVWLDITSHLWPAWIEFTNTKGAIMLEVHFWRYRTKTNLLPGIEEINV